MNKKRYITIAKKTAGIQISELSKVKRSLIALLKQWI